MSDTDFTNSTPKEALDLLSAVAIADDILAGSTDERSIGLADKFLQDVAELVVPSSLPVQDSAVADYEDDDEMILLADMYKTMQENIAGVPRHYGEGDYDAFRKYLVRNHNDTLYRDENGRIVVNEADVDFFYSMIF